MWARQYERCVVCGTTEHEHDGKGICKKCRCNRDTHNWGARYREAHHEQDLERKRRYYQSHRKAEALRAAAWRMANPEARRMADARRKRRSRAICPETPELWENRRILLETIGACQECGGKEGLETHHIAPRTTGPNHSLENLRLLCHKCHRRAHGCDV